MGDSLGVPSSEAGVGERIVQLGVELGRVDDLGSELAANDGARKTVPRALANTRSATVDIDRSA